MDPVALLLDVDPATRASLTASGVLRRVRLETVATADAALSRLAHDVVDALVIGPLSLEPIPIAQRACRESALLAVMIVADPQHYQRVCGQLTFAPYVNSNTRCEPQTAGPALADTLKRALETSRRQRAHRRTLQRASHRLSTTPAPLPHTAVLDRLLEVAPIGVLELDQAGRIRTANPAAQSILRVEKASGRQLEELLSVQAAEVFRSLWQGLPHDPSGRSEGQLELSRTDEPAAIVGVTVTALPSGTLVLLQDVTQRVLLERERVGTVEQLSTALRARDVFLSVAAHELNTPLTALRLQLQLLGRDATASPSVRSRLETSQRQLLRIAGLVDGLLDVGRLSQGALQISREKLDLSQLVSLVCGETQPQAEKVGAVLELDAPSPVIGQWDRLRLEQVCAILLTNALKYGAGRPVHVSVRREGERALLIVRDEGIGIPPDAVSRIFDRFERAVPENHYGGLGLGLYIAREIVVAHGGTISAGSNSEGRGAVFTVSLPLNG